MIINKYISFNFVILLISFLTVFHNFIQLMYHYPYFIIFLYIFIQILMVVWKTIHNLNFNMLLLFTIIINCVEGFSVEFNLSCFNMKMRKLVVYKSIHYLSFTHISRANYTYSILWIRQKSKFLFRMSIWSLLVRRILGSCHFYYYLYLFL